MPAEPPAALAGWPPQGAGTALVIDTNVALDLLVFKDPATAELRDALAAGQVVWLATQAMRDELERVLGYPKLAARVTYHQCNTPQVLAAMDRLCRWEAPAPKAPVTCPDADDQKFIDLALAHRAALLSKDQHITGMRKRLSALGVHTAPRWGGLWPAGH